MKKEKNMNSQPEKYSVGEYFKSLGRKGLFILIAILLIGAIGTCSYFAKTTFHIADLDNKQLAFYVNEELTEKMPAKDSGMVFDTEKSSCTNGATIEFDDNDWSPIVKNISVARTKCTLYFKEKSGSMLAERGCGDYYSCGDTTRVFQSDYIQNTTRIVFQNEMNSPTTFVGEFDESADKDGSVKAYVVANEDPGTYTIYFQTRRMFMMPSDSSNYFNGFEKVTLIEGLEHVDTSNVTNMSVMFANMSSLESLDLSSFDTNNVTNMGWMFQYCSNLTSIDVSSFNTNKVEKMNSMFRNTALKELDVSNFDTRNVTNMESMFRGMSSLTGLDLSNFNTSNVTDMRDMFNGMSILTSLNVSSFDTQNVTNMSGMFSWMKSLTSLDLSSFDTQNVESFGIKSNLNAGMFAQSSNLKSIIYGENFIRKEGSNINGMFRSCTANKPTHSSWDGATY